MSPALKSKSKDKSAAKATKEPQKVSSKPSPAIGNGSSIPANAYNPASGTFHTLESAPSASSPLPRNNIWFGHGDEMEEQSGSSLGTAADYDSDDNSSDCDEPKEKATTSNNAPKTETVVPGSYADKRDKIRQKNERKHQRQREKRAQELHEKCSGYLMSRKLEALSQQLVSMGFPAERATMALILNEGRVEDSVSWLLVFEGGRAEGKQANTTNLDSSGNLKIDISEELARISEMEINFKCSKQEVERAVVSCEGDLEKAVDILKAQKQAVLPPSPPRLENQSDHILASRNNKVMPPTQNGVTRLQAKPSASVGIQPSREEKDISLPKVVLAGSGLPPNGRNTGEILMPSKVLDGRWSHINPNPSVSHPQASSLQAVLAAKTESHYVGTNEVMNSLKAGTLREPVIMMQRPQSANLKHNLPSASVGLSTSPPVSTGWYPNGTSSLDMFRSLEQGMGRMNVNGRSYSPNQQQFYHQSHHQSSFMDNGSTFWDASSASWASSGSHSFGSLASEWQTEEVRLRDYTRIDWSHNLAPLRRNSVPNLKIDRLNKTWSTTFMGTGLSPQKPALKVNIPSFQDGGGHIVSTPSAAGVGEWTSPFQGNDLLRVPRQSVTSPTLNERGF